MVMALISPLRGQVDEVILRVDGLACPFCAYGIEKKLKKLEGARSLEIMINEGKIVMEWNSDSTLDLEAINKAVETAGFTLRGVRASVRGALMSDSGMFYLLTPNTPEQRFYLYESAEITRPTFSEIGEAAHNSASDRSYAQPAAATPAPCKCRENRRSFARGKASRATNRLGNRESGGSLVVNGML